MSYNYYISTCETNKSVNFKFLGTHDILIKDFKGRDCFSRITYEQLSTDIKKIIVYHSLDAIPYPKEIITLWINEINELGFPCTLQFIDNNAEFIIDLSKYERKLHLNCTLQLIRILYETGINFVPELYLNLIKSFPNKDKFLILQDAHKALKTCGYAYYYNENHIITGTNHSPDNVDRKTLFNRIQDTNLGTYGHCNTFGMLSKLWKA